MPDFMAIATSHYDLVLQYKSVNSCLLDTFFLPSKTQKRRNYCYSKEKPLAETLRRRERIAV